jgi:hypothetical protein
VPVLLSDAFEGVFPSSVPWETFSLRFAETAVAVGRGATGAAVNLTAELLAVASDGARLASMQRALQQHAADVLWEAPGSRVGSHALGLASRAVSHVCKDGVGQPPPPATVDASSAKRPGAQITFAPLAAAV